MVKDLGDKVIEIQTSGGIVFSIEALGSSEEHWTYFANGKINIIYGTYVTKEVCGQIREKYLDLSHTTSDKTTEDYEEKLSNLIRFGRKAGHHGENGYALILVCKNREYDLKLHKIDRRSIISRKKETPKPIEKSPSSSDVTSGSKISLLNPVSPSAIEHFRHSSIGFVTGKPKK